MVNKKNLKDITVIFALYKTPHILIKQFDQYKGLNLIILDQSSDQCLKNKILRKNLMIEKYIMLKSNIGFAKACNLLLKKVKTKYCLLTQVDININSKAIEKLLNTINKNKNCIIAAPNLNQNRNRTKLQLVKNVIGANFLFNVKKMNKLKFFDEQFFLYWEDVDLCHRIMDTEYEIIIVNNARAKHFNAESSINNLQTFFIRNINFKLG